VDRAHSGLRVALRARFVVLAPGVGALVVGPEFASGELQSKLLARLRLRPDALLGLAAWLCLVCLLTADFGRVDLCRPESTSMSMLHELLSTTEVPLCTGAGAGNHLTAIRWALHAFDEIAFVICKLSLLLLALVAALAAAEPHSLMPGRVRLLCGRLPRFPFSSSTAPRVSAGSALGLPSPDRFPWESLRHWLIFFCALAWVVRSFAHGASEVGLLYQ
jgi:hypothetical protein